MNYTAPGVGHRNPACTKLVIEMNGTAPCWGDNEDEAVWPKSQVGESNEGDCTELGSS
jgi:hypothetical protein